MPKSKGGGKNCQYTFALTRERLKLFFTQLSVNQLSFYGEVEETCENFESTMMIKVEESGHPVFRATSSKGKLVDSATLVAPCHLCSFSEGDKVHSYRLVGLRCAGPSLDENFNQLFEPWHGHVLRGGPHRLARIQRSSKAIYVLFLHTLKFGMDDLFLFDFMTMNVMSM